MYKASLKYADGKLVSGWQTYEMDDVLGNSMRLQCDYDAASLNWIALPGKVCNLTWMIPVPTTKTELKENIDTGKFKLKSESTRFDTIYKIT